MRAKLTFISLIAVGVASVSIVVLNASRPKVQIQKEGIVRSMGNYQSPKSNAKTQEKALTGVQLTARLGDVSKTLFKPLEPIAVQLALKNTSTQPISFEETASVRDYDLIVKDSIGNVMPVTRYGYKYTPGEVPPSSAAQLKSLPLNGEALYKLTINRIVDMTVDGTYTATIRVHRIRRQNASGAFETGYAESNALHVTVATPDDDERSKTLPGGEPVEEEKGGK